MKILQAVLYFAMINTGKYLNLTAPIFCINSSMFTYKTDN
jgi:hypothetical protein